MILTDVWNLFSCEFSCLLSNNLVQTQGQTRLMYTKLKLMRVWDESRRLVTPRVPDSVLRQGANEEFQRVIFYCPHQTIMRNEHSLGKIRWMVENVFVIHKNPLLWILHAMFLFSDFWRQQSFGRWQVLSHVFEPRLPSGRGEWGKVWSFVVESYETGPQGYSYTAVYCKRNHCKSYM